jgi:hypothetical protein
MRILVIRPLVYWLLSWVLHRLSVLRLLWLAMLPKRLLGLLLRYELRWRLLRCVLVQWLWGSLWLQGMRRAHVNLTILVWRRLLRLNTLVALRIETGVHVGFRVFELLLSTLKWSMLSLLPRWDIWRWWNVDTRHGICVRWHICLHALTCQRRGDICWLLLIRAHHSLC